MISSKIMSPLVSAQIIGTAKLKTYFNLTVPSCSRIEELNYSTNATKNLKTEI